MKIRILAVILLVALLFTGCSKTNNTENPMPNPQEPNGPAGPAHGQTGDHITPDDDSSFGENLGDLGALDGIFDGVKNDVVIRCESGTGGCYEIGDGVINFTSISADSVYSISGQFTGQIFINTGDAYKFELELCGFSLVSTDGAPIIALSGDEVTIQAKKGTKNYIYDKRDAVAENGFESINAAIYSQVDLEISGKGEMNIVSDNNNGIHSKKDLQIKNLSLIISASDNTVKGNDSVSFENATATIISTLGDGVKTTKNDISAKGKQRGIVSFEGGSYEIYAACDGIDSAYNVVIDGSETIVNIYTDKYSNYSKEVTAVAKDVYYIRSSNNNYKYSVKYYNSDSEYTWVDAQLHSTVSAGYGKNYYYYSFAKLPGYSDMQFYMYSSDMAQGQDASYVVKSDFLTPSTAYDTIAVSVRNSSISYNWTNYTTSNVGGPGGGPGDEGNTDKGDHSTKGIKALNEIIVNSGYLSIKSYDDAIHSKNDTALDNSTTPKGNVNINGGKVTIYTNDDGIHADGHLTVNGGTVSIVNSYEGMEGITVNILGGQVSINSKDDGINATATSGTSITIGCETLYIYCNGDCIDSNSRASYAGIVFNSGKCLLITTSGGNSAIDSEQGYAFNGGTVVAVMPKGGMSSESTKCSNFSSIGKSTGIAISKGDYLECTIGSQSLTARMPASISSATVVTLGSSSVSVTKSTTGSAQLEEGEFLWK